MAGKAQGWKCEDCGWPWPLAGSPPAGAECDNCGGELVPAEDTFGYIARKLAGKVAAGTVTQEDAERALRLEPGERLAPTGVIAGSGAHRGTPRFGQDSNDQDYVPEEPES